jgi:hypothetical protein
MNDLLHQLQIAPPSDRHTMAVAAVGSAVLLVVAAAVQLIAL